MNQFPRLEALHHADEREGRLLVYREGLGYWRAEDPTDAITDRTRRIFLGPGAFAINTGTPARAFVGSSATVTEDIDAWAFDGAAAEVLGTNAMMPSDWDGGAVTAVVHWAPSDTTAGNVYWQVYLASIAAAEQVDQAYADVASIIVAAGGTADVKKSSSGSITLSSGTDPFLKCLIVRQAADALDTYNAQDAWFLGLEIQYTADS